MMRWWPVALLGAAALLPGTVMAGPHCDSDGVGSQLAQLRQQDTDFRRGTGPAMDADNITRLKQLVAHCGWPRRSRHGEQAALTAFLIVQHAGLADQLQLLPLLEQAAAADELPKGLLPLLQDRIDVRQGRLQRYGTQLQGVCTPAPIANPDLLDQRREAAGLMPYDQYLALCRNKSVENGL